jgi:hypothetical protein
MKKKKDAWALPIQACVFDFFYFFRVDKVKFMLFLKDTIMLYKGQIQVMQGDLKKKTSF